MPGGPELSDKVPDAIFQLVESFKKFVREQKAHRDQKFDVDPILQVDKDTDDFELAFQRVSVDCDTNKQLIEQIKNDTIKLLRHAELAYSLLRPYLANTVNLHQQNQPQQQQQQQQQQQHNQFGPFGTSYLDFSPLKIQSSRYFADLADDLETRIRKYGECIKELKTSLESKIHNVDDLFKWLKKQHQILGDVAAKVYMTHEMIMERTESDMFDENSRTRFLHCGSIHP